MCVDVLDLGGFGPFLYVVGFHWSLIELHCFSYIRMGVCWFPSISIDFHLWQLRHRHPRIQRQQHQWIKPWQSPQKKNTKGQAAQWPVVLHISQRQRLERCQGRSYCLPQRLPSTAMAVCNFCSRDTFPGKRHQRRIALGRWQRDESAHQSSAEDWQASARHVKRCCSCRV